MLGLFALSLALLLALPLALLLALLLAPDRYVGHVRDGAVLLVALALGCIALSAHEDVKDAFRRWARHEGVAVDSVVCFPSSAGLDATCTYTYAVWREDAAGRRRRLDVTGRLTCTRSVCGPVRLAGVPAAYSQP